MTTLSTHVLDTMHGRPAAQVSVRLTDRAGALLFDGVTDADGRWRVPAPLTAGSYTLWFSVAAHFRALGVELAEPPFLDEVAITFGIAEGSGHYHVPLLVSPFAYSTYRGS